MAPSTKGSRREWQAKEITGRRVDGESTRSGVSSAANVCCMIILFRYLLRCLVVRQVVRLGEVTIRCHGICESIEWDRAGEVMIQLHTHNIALLRLTLGLKNP